MTKKLESIFFDLDGSTLEGQSFSDGFVQILKEYQDKNWFMTTGRSIMSVKRMGLHHFMDEHTPHIFDNGALISNFHGDVIDVSALATSAKKSTLDYFGQAIRSGLEFDYVFASVFPGAAYVWCPNESLLANFTGLNICQTYSEFVDATADKDILKLTIKNPEVFNSWKPDGVSIVLQHSCCDVVSPLVSKGRAIDQVRQELNLEPANMAFVCDDRNDISALIHLSLQDMFVIQVGEKIVGERCNIRVNSPEEVGATLSKLFRTSDLELTVTASPASSKTTANRNDLADASNHAQAFVAFTFKIAVCTPEEEPALRSEALKHRGALEAMVSMGIISKSDAEDLIRGASENAMAESQTNGHTR